MLTRWAPVWRRWLLVVSICGWASAGHAAGGEDTLNQAEAARASGDLATAQQLAQGVLAQLDSGTDDPLLRADAYNTLGAIELTRGQPRAALAAIERAYALCLPLAPDGRRMLRILNNLGYAQRDLGDLDGADGHLRRALELAEALAPASVLPGVIAHNLAQNDYARGDYEAAVGHFERALKVAHEVDPDGPREAAGWLGLGGSLEALDRLGAADAAMQHAATLFGQIAADCHCSGLALLDLGGYALRRQDRRGARVHIETLLALAETVGLLRAGALRGLAQVDLADSAVADSPDAREQALSAANAHLLEALKLEQAQEASSLSLAHTHFLLGQVAAARGLPARKHYCDAATVLDAVRIPRSADNLAQAQFRARYTEVYFECARAELTAGRPKAAFAAWERARARGLLEALTQRDLNLQPGVTAAAIQWVGADQARAALAPDEVALSYAVGADETLVFRLRRADLRVVRVALGAAQAEQQVQALRARIGRRDTAGLAAIRRAAGAWYQQLIAPFEPELGADTHLLISADGPLAELPFAALWSAKRQRWLVEDWPLTQIDSFATRHWQQAQARASSAQLLALADPLLPGADAGTSLRGFPALPALPAAVAEVRGLPAIFRGRSEVLLGAAASEANARQQGRKASVLHFAVHAVFDPLRPLESALLLSADGTAADDDGLLHAHEVYANWRLKADLVVLSACETARGARFAGEGLLGLSRAFQFAGAHAVLATLWRVEDRATADLMTEFYRARSQGLALDVALQQAMLSQLRAPSATGAATPDRGVGGLTAGAAAANRAHPHAWAGLVLKH